MIPLPPIVEAAEDLNPLMTRECSVTDGGMDYLARLQRI